MKQFPLPVPPPPLPPLINTSQSYVHIQLEWNHFESTDASSCIEVRTLWKYGVSVGQAQYNLLPHKADYWGMHDGAWGNLALISCSLEPFLSQFVRVGATCALIWGWKEKHVLWLAPGDKFVLLTDTKRDFIAVMEENKCVGKWNNIVKSEI